MAPVVDERHRPRLAVFAAAAAVVIIAVGLFIAFGQDGDRVSQQPTAPPDPEPVGMFGHNVIAK
jgi:hypothetical protein